MLFASRPVEEERRSFGRFLDQEPLSATAFCSPNYGCQLWYIIFRRNFFVAHKHVALLILLSLFLFWSFFLGRDSSKNPKAPSSQIGSEWNFVLQVNTHWLIEWDFLCDVVLSKWRLWRSLAARWCSSVRRLPASSPNACTRRTCVVYVIRSLYALQFLVRSTFVVVRSIVIRCICLYNCSSWLVGDPM